jgi:ABC-type transport system substrate-binding protein
MAEDRNYWRRGMSRRLSRRGVLRGAALGSAGIAGAVLIGCGDDDGDGTATPAASGTAAATGTAADGTATAAPTSDGGAMAPVRGGVRSAVSANVYDSVDSHQSVASPSVGVLSRAHSKILRFTNPNTGDLVGDLAETWEVPSPSEVILHLRPGVTWHDAGPGAANPAASPGRELTAEDIVYNIERQQSGTYADGTETSYGRRSYWQKVTNIEVADSSIKLTLGADDVTFVQGLANEFNQIGQPEMLEAVESTFSEIDPAKVIGTGPYIVTEWIPGERISFVRNPTYYNPDRPYLDGAVWGQAFEDPTAYRIGWEQKQVDSFSDPDPTVVLSIQEGQTENSYLLYSGVANTVAAYTNPNIAPWNDARLVKAIDLALNRRQLIQQLHNGLGKVSGPVTWMQEAWALSQESYENRPGYRTDGAGREDDVAEANKLWIAAGGPDLGQIDWVVAETWASRSSWTITPELVSEIFNTAFNTTQFRGKTGPYGEIIPSWTTGNFEPFFAWIPNIEIPDARADMIAYYKSDSPSNIWGINQPDEIDAPLTQALAELDNDAAYELVAGVQEYILENGQFGRHIAYNYINPGLFWNYVHKTGPAEGEDWNFLAGSLDGLDEWIDPNDPSYVGRDTPTPTPV